MVLKTAYLRVLCFKKLQLIYSPLNYFSKEMRRRYAERPVEKIKTYSKVKMDQEKIKGNCFPMF